MRRNLYKIVLLLILLPLRSVMADISLTNPYVAGVASGLVSGSGYFFIDENSKGFLGLGVLGLQAQSQYWTADNWTKKSVKSHLGNLGSNLHGFMVFDSFHDALEKDEAISQARLVKTPHYSMKDFLTASVDKRSYSSWKPFVPIGLGVLSLGLNLSSKGLHRGLKFDRAAGGLIGIALLTAFVGMGEEAEFRGFQLPAFSQLTGSPFMGNVLQAAAFGSCHTSWGTCSNGILTDRIFSSTATRDRRREYRAPGAPSDGSDTSDEAYFATTFIYGLFFGWMTTSEEHGLLMSTASHTLFDFLLMSSDLLTTGNTGRVYLSTEFTFK